MMNDRREYVNYKKKKIRDAAGILSQQWAFLFHTDSLFNEIVKAYKILTKVKAHQSTTNIPIRLI